MVGHGLFGAGFEFQNADAAGHGFGIALAGAERLIVGGQNVDRVAEGVKGHRARAHARGNGGQKRGFAAAFADDGQRSRTASGAKRQAGLGVEASGVHARSDGKVGEDFPTFGIENDQRFVAATGEKMAGSGVVGEAGRLLAGRKRENADELVGARVELRDLRTAFEVDPDGALAVRRCRFGIAGKSGRGDDFFGRHLDERNAFALAVHRENLVGGGFIKNGVGAVADGDCASGGERAQVEGHDAILTAARGESQTRPRRKRDAVRCLQAFDLADLLAGARVENLDARVARHE